MRIKIAIIILLVVGIVLTANLLINNRTLSPVQFKKVTTACMGCHGSIPQYDAAIMIHNKHAALNCSHCHSDISGLKVTERAHTSLEWMGIGIMLLAFTGVITNLLIINRKGRAN